MLTSSLPGLIQASFLVSAQLLLFSQDRSIKNLLGSYLGHMRCAVFSTMSENLVLLISSFHTLFLRLEPSILRSIVLFVQQFIGYYWSQEKYSDWDISTFFILLDCVSNTTDVQDGQILIFTIMLTWVPNKRLREIECCILWPDFKSFNIPCIGSSLERVEVSMS